MPLRYALFNRIDRANPKAIGVVAELLLISMDCD